MPCACLLRANHIKCLSLLKSCSSMNQLLQIHAQYLRSRLFEDSFASSKMVEIFSLSEHGCIHYAHKIFDQITHPTIFTWNTIIRGYSVSPFPKFSLHIFHQMISLGCIPNLCTFPFVIKACTRLEAREEGRQVHVFILKCGAENDIFSVNSLIHMYAALGYINSANSLFETCPNRDLVSWNSMLSGYVSCGLVDKARQLFVEMPERGTVSWNTIITGYTKSGNVDFARELFDQMPHRNVETWNALIVGYAKCDQLVMARQLFNEMPVRNVVSWSAIITAYAQGCRPLDALAMFKELHNSGMQPNSASIVSALSACAQLGALEHGRRIQILIHQSKVQADSIIATALIDMYAKCGSIDDALGVFYGLVSKEVFSWTAIIGGLAVNGRADKALELFAQMEKAPVMPNAVTFIGVLCACSHKGLVHLGRRYFDAMRTAYRIEPQIEHYGCLIDLFGRAGILQAAVSVVETMPLEPNAVIWGTLLGACWIHGNAEIAEFTAQRFVELKSTDGGTFVLLSNIYAMLGRRDQAKRLRNLIKSKGMLKVPGQSLIEVNGIVHNFYVRDTSHPKTQEIYQMLGEMIQHLKLVGYEAYGTALSFDIGEDKEHSISHHSEKLSTAFSS